MGVALDIWTAYREGVFGEAPPPPWLGYLFVLEDSPASRASVQVAEPHFAVLPEFRGASYAQRYELFCHKMVRERHFTAACFLVTNREQAAQNPNYTEPCSDLSAANFLHQLIRHAL
jgi:hypothetical protein